MEKLVGKKLPDIEFPQHDDWGKPKDIDHVVLEGLKDENADVGDEQSLDCPGDGASADHHPLGLVQHVPYNLNLDPSGHKSPPFRKSGVASEVGGCESRVTKVMSIEYRDKSIDIGGS